MTTTAQPSNPSHPSLASRETPQLDLPLCAPTTTHQRNDPTPLINFLKGKGWMTATQILRAMDKPADESGKRSIRAMADNSEGQIAGGQLGYKLVREMTKDEYDHFRNWMSAQADHMRHRIIESDKIWFTRHPIK